MHAISSLSYRKNCISKLVFLRYDNVEIVILTVIIEDFRYLKVGIAQNGYNESEMVILPSLYRIPPRSTAAYRNRASIIPEIFRYIP